MKTLVTGGSGWIGSHLVRYLINEGDEVFNYDIVGGHDITKLYQLENAFEWFEPDRVFHLAGQAFMAPGEKDPHRDVTINTFGMINLLTCLEEWDIPMVYTSSGAVYGISPILPHKEDAPCFPVSNYGVSKLAGEYYLKKWVATKGVNAKILRFSSVYGLGRSHGPVNIFINKAFESKPLAVYGDGSQTRDLTYIMDAILGLRIVGDKGTPGEIYNIGSGVETSVREVAEIIAENLGAEITYVEHEFSQFDLKRSWYDLTKANNIGYFPQYTVERGIRRTMELERERHDM